MIYLENVAKIRPDIISLRMGRESLGAQLEHSHKMRFESTDSNFGDEKFVKIKEKKSPAEVLELREKMRIAAKVLSDRFDLKVIPGERWAAGLPKEFEKEMLKNPDKKFTEIDPKLLIPDTITFPEEHLVERSEDFVWGVLRHEISHIRHSDYLSLISSQDEVKKEGYEPTDYFTVYNGWEDGRSNTMEGQSSETAKIQLGNYLREDLAETVLNDLENKPLPIQYSALSWAKGTQDFVPDFDFEKIKNKIKDEDVLKAFEETEAVLEAYLVEADGRKAFKDLLWEKAWPVFKKLIDKQIEQDAKKEFEEEQNKKEKDEKNTEPQIWNDLPPESRKKYTKEARKRLTEKELEFVKPLQPKSIEVNKDADGNLKILMPLSPEDLKNAEKNEENFLDERRKAEKKLAEEKQKEMDDLKKAQDKFKERESGLSKEEQEIYNKYFSDVKKYVNLFVEKLDVIFPPSEKAEWEGGRMRGKRIDARRLAREMPTGRGKAFEQKEVPEITQLAFSLLVDVSGSMGGEKIEEALRAAMLMAESFSKKNIPFELASFNGNYWILKAFDEQYFGKKKMEILKVLQQVIGGYSGYNDDGFAVDSSARRLQKRLLSKGANGALIVFSDGQPMPTDSHSGPEWDLAPIVRKWSKQIPLIGVGIGPGMDETIGEYYGKNGLPVPDVHQLPNALVKILTKQIRKFEEK